MVRATLTLRAARAHAQAGVAYWHNCPSCKQPVTGREADLQHAEVMQARVAVAAAAVGSSRSSAAHLLAAWQQQLDSARLESDSKIRLCFECV